MGVSDFDKMVVTGLQTYYRKRKAKKLDAEATKIVAMKPLDITC